MSVLRADALRKRFKSRAVVDGVSIEVASGERYEEFLQKRVFDPLGMKDTGFFVPGEEGSKENLTRHLLAFDRKDGKKIWDTAVAAKLPEEDRIRDHGFAAVMPIGPKRLPLRAGEPLLGGRPDFRQFFQSPFRFSHLAPAEGGLRKV